MVSRRKEQEIGSAPLSPPDRTCSEVLSAKAWTLLGLGLPIGSPVVSYGDSVNSLSVDLETPRGNPGRHSANRHRLYVPYVQFPKVTATRY